MSLKNKRMLGEFKVLSLFLVLIQEMWTISLCNPSAIKLLSLDPLQAGWCRLVRVEDYSHSSWFLFYGEGGSDFVLGNECKI